MLGSAANAASTPQFPQDADGEPWDVQANQELSTGSGAVGTGGRSVPFDGFGYWKVRISNAAGLRLSDTRVARGLGLQQDGDRYDSLTPAVIGPVVVSRALYAPGHAVWLRAFDAFTNVGTEPVIVDAAWGGGAGMMRDGGWATVAATSSGDRLIDPSDGYVVMMQNALGVADPMKGPSGNGPSAQVLGDPATQVFQGAGDMYRDPFLSSYPGRDPAQIGYRFRIVLNPGQSKALVTFLVKGQSEFFDPRGNRPRPHVPSDAAHAESYEGVAVPEAERKVASAGTQIARVLNIARQLLATPDFSGLTRHQRSLIVNWNVKADEHLAIELVKKDLTALIADLREGRVTSEDLVTASLARVAAFSRSGPGLSAVVTINPQVFHEARAADQARLEGSLGVLQGVPIAFKDNIDVLGMPTTGGLDALRLYRPRIDSTMAARLRAAGAIMLAKSNLDQFPFGDFGDSETGGRVKNAFDHTLNSAGSSGGSAVGTAWGLYAAAYGTDTCNSLTNLASFASLSTIRTTLGLTSRAGVMPLRPLDDAVGPLTRSVRDLALLLQVTAGPDPADTATGSAPPRPASYLDSLDPSALRGARIGIVPQLFWEWPADPQIIEAMQQIERELAQAGAVVIPVRIPDLKQYYRPSQAADAQRALARDAWKRYLSRGAWDGQTIADATAASMLPGMHGESRMVLADIGGASTPTPEQSRILWDERTRFASALTGALERSRLDALVYPAALSRPATQESGRARYGYEPGTCEESARTGLPVVTTPGAFLDDGRLPLGITLLGRPWSESRLLALAYAYEQSFHHHRAPPGSTLE